MAYNERMVQMSDVITKKVQKTDAEWREELTPEQYQILRQAGTERPFTGPYWNAKDKGIYSCAGCGTDLFVSDTKFDSGCGWPSYFEAVSPDAVTELRDTTHGMVRTEVRCATCNGHLGHVFPDGPPPTGLRYCINGHSMNFRPAD
jgi:peptide-methionine (R)-S-oxide reductase